MSEFHQLAEPDTEVEQVEVRRNATLSAVLGLLACAVAIGYLTRVSHGGGIIDIVICAAMVVVGLTQLVALIDARTPLLAADDSGIRIRLGQEWLGLPWSTLEQVIVERREGLVPDGRMILVPRDPEVLESLLPSARRALRWQKLLHGAPLAVPLSLATKVSSDDLENHLRELAGRRTEIVAHRGRHRVKVADDTERTDPAAVRAARAGEPVETPGSFFDQFAEPDLAEDAAHTGDTGEAAASVEDDEPTAEVPTAEPLSDTTGDEHAEEPAARPASFFARLAGRRKAAEVVDPAEDADEPTGEVPTAESVPEPVSEPVSGPVTGRPEDAEEPRPTPEPVDSEQDEAEHDEDDRDDPDNPDNLDHPDDQDGEEQEPVEPVAKPIIKKVAAPVAAIRTARSIVRTDVESERARPALPEQAPEPIPTEATADRIVIGEEHHEAADEPVIGPQIRAARERARLSVDELSDRTRIRPHVLESIEVDDFEPCGGDFYARGHLATLARYLGLNYPELSAEYDARYSHAPVDARRVFEAELAQGMSGGIRATRGGPRWGLVAAVVLGLLMVWGIARFFTTSPTEVVSSSPYVGDSAGLSAHHEQVSSPQASDSVTIKAIGGRTQVAVLDANHHVVWKGLLHRGEEHVANGTGPLTVKASDAAATRVKFHGLWTGPVGTTTTAADKRFG